MNVTRISPRTLERALGDWRDSGPLHRSLAGRLRLLILDGRLPPASRLPSERALADALSISRTTVGGAYDSLRASGYAVSRRGSGTEAALPGPSRDLPAVPGTEELIDLGKASLPAAMQVSEALRSAAEELPRFLHDAGYDGRGVPHLRTAIAAHYSARGLPTSADEVLVTLGAQHAIHLLTQVLLRPGDRALVESPTYPHALDALRAAKARVVAVSVAAAGHASPSRGDDGWDVDSAVDAFARTQPSLAYLMPDFHNPTGSSMSADTRERMLAAARRSGTTVISDETTAFFSTEAEGVDAAGERSLITPLGARAGAGRPGRRADSVVHIGSAGKLFWGGLRVGWIRGDRRLVERLIAARPAFDLGTPVMEQLATEALLRRLPEVLVERSRQLRLGAATVARLAAAHLPDWDLPTVSGGLTAWAHLPRPVSSLLSLAAHEHGVLLPAGPRFGLHGAAFERFVRVPITAPPDLYGVAMPALAEAWQQVRDGGSATGWRQPPDAVV